MIPCKALTHKRIGTALALILIICHPLCAEVHSVMHLSFDPSVEGTTPSLLLTPNPEKAKDFDGTVRLVAYALEGYEEIPLATHEVDIVLEKRFYLPSRDREDILGVRVEKVDQDGRIEPIAAWRALYRPGRGVLDYTGSNELQRPSDFSDYWGRTLKELAAIPMEPEIASVSDRTTATGKLYRVKLNSYGNIPIVCWYYVPLDVEIGNPAPDRKQYPAIQIMPGWGAEEPPLDRTAEGYITLSVNPRAHGPSKEFFTTPIPHHLWNIDAPETYYYRAAYMDCMRGIDFLISRPEVDARHIGVEGGSQGGAFTLAMAALDPRVAAAAANVPYLSNFPDFTRLATNGSGTTFGQLMLDPEKGERVRHTLALIDIANLAPWIQCPTLVCVGSQDRVCPPLNGIVAINRLPEGIPRKLVMDPAADHEVTPLMREANRDWFAKYLKQE